MRALKWSGGLLSIVLASYLYLAFVLPIHPAPDRPFFRGTRTLVIAHQGGRGLWPENTLFAFEHADELGADVLEMDLRTTRDGRVVVLHDPTLDRTTDGTGPVVDLDLDEVRKLDAGYRFEGEAGEFPYRANGLQVPTLEEVLARFPSRRLNLEMKEFGIEEARRFCETLRRYQATEHVLVASFGHAPMLAFREACPEVATSVTMREGLLFYQLTRLRLGSLFRTDAAAFEVPEYFREIHVVRPAFVDLARRFHLHVQVWTVNDEEDLRRMLGLGVDGIITDYPDRLLRMMERLDGTS
jgi:glycerophosphoryl diester phosphodiesterase